MRSTWCAPLLRQVGFRFGLLDRTCNLREVQIDDCRELRSPDSRPRRPRIDRMRSGDCAPRPCLTSATRRTEADRAHLPECWDIIYPGLTVLSTDLP